MGQDLVRGVGKSDPRHRLPAAKARTGQRRDSPASNGWAWRGQARGPIAAEKGARDAILTMQSVRAAEV